MPVKRSDALSEMRSRFGLRDGRYGEFIACSAYPKCRYSEECAGKHSGSLPALRFRTGIPA